MYVYEYGDSCNRVLSTLKPIWNAIIISMDSWAKVFLHERIDSDPNRDTVY